MSQALCPHIWHILIFQSSFYSMEIIGVLLAESKVLFCGLNSLTQYHKLMSDEIKALHHWCEFVLNTDLSCILKTESSALGHGRDPTWDCISCNKTYAKSFRSIELLNAWHCDPNATDYMKHNSYWKNLLGWFLSLKLFLKNAYFNWHTRFIPINGELCNIGTYVMYNDQIRVIGKFIQSDRYHFFALETLKIFSILKYTVNFFKDTIFCYRLLEIIKFHI